MDSSLERQFFQLKAFEKASQYARVLGTVHKKLARETEDHLNGEELVKLYGFHVGPMTIAEAKVYKQMVEALEILTIQYLNMFRYDEHVRDSYGDFVYKINHVPLKRAVDSKDLLFVQSRILYNQRTYNLDEDGFPRERCTYNEFLVRSFLSNVSSRNYVFARTLEDLDRLPQELAVKYLVEHDRISFSEGIRVIPARKLRRNSAILEERNIMLAY